MAALNVAEFRDHEIIPVDNGLTTATVAFSGNFNNGLGTPASIKLQLVRHTGGATLQAYFSPVSSSFNAGAGTWTGSWTIPGGSDFVAQVRTFDGGGGTLETSAVNTVPWGVGQGGGQVGQSHWVEMNQEISSPPAAWEWGRLFDGTTFSLPVGNGNILMFNGLNSFSTGLGLGGTDIPYVVTSTGVGGAGVTVDGGGGFWLSNTAGQPFPVFKTKSGALKNPLNIILNCGGSTDAVLGVSYATLYAGTVNLRNNINSFFVLSSAQLPWCTVINGRVNDGTTTDAAWQVCKDTDIDFAATEINAHLFASITDLPLGGSDSRYHLTAAGYGHMGDRIAASWAKLLGYNSGADGVSMPIGSALRIFGSPNITISPTLNGATFLQFADNTTVGAGQTGWQVSKDGFVSFLTVSSTSFSAAKTILTLSATPANGDAVQVRYEYGVNSALDLTKVVYGNVFPSGDTLPRPLVPSSSNSPINVTATAFGIAPLLEQEMVL